MTRRVRGLALLGAAVAVFGSVPARAGDGSMPIGEIARPGGGKFTIAAGYETVDLGGGKRRRDLCLQTHALDPDGSDRSGGSSCPITAPRKLLVIPSIETACTRPAATLLVGTIDPSVAKVSVQAKGVAGTLVAQRFDAPPGLGLNVAFFAVALRGSPLVTKLQLRDAAGHSLLVQRWPFGEQHGCRPSRFRGHRDRVVRGRLSDVRYTLFGYRRDVIEQGRILRDQLCLQLDARGLGATPSPFEEDPADTCGLQPTRRTKAFNYAGETFGCGSKSWSFFYGLARPRVARIVAGFRHGSAAAEPVALPRRLHSHAKAFVVVLPRGAVVDSLTALDSHGRRLSFESFRGPGPHVASSSTECGSSYGGGTA